jgi:hypothetical protein
MITINDLKSRRYEFNPQNTAGQYVEYSDSELEKMNHDLVWLLNDNDVDLNSNDADLLVKHYQEMVLNHCVFLRR